MQQEQETIRHVRTETDLRICFPLIQQLRPHIKSPEELLSRWRRQETEGYRMVALLFSGTPVAVAGYRVTENLIHGRHFYIDDLVTDAKLRSSGFGARLMNFLKEEATRSGCARLTLDTPMSNVLGHRFYYRQGLVAGALRFNIALAHDASQ